MGFAAIDPHSHKVQTKLYKISKFDPNVSKIQPFENVKFYKEMYGIWTLSDTASGWPYISFVNFDIFKRLDLACVWVYLHQTWGFCKAWSALYDYVDQ